MNKYSAFISKIKYQDIKFLFDSPMSAQITFKVGGNADIIAFPKNTDELMDLIAAAKECCIPVTLLGNGSNVLVRDDGIRGLVIKTTHMTDEIVVSDDKITCPAGVILSKLCVTALDNSLTGLEFAYGIPGTVGGAVYMNAGAYGGEMKDVLVSVTHLTPDGIVKTVDADKLELTYRESFYSKNTGYVILSAAFKLNKGDKNSIRSQMDELMGRRKSKQPLEHPSAGSTFKRPTGYFAGALIEECNLKGFHIGEAEVSEKHAGFVVNKGNATATDVLNLIDHIIATVKKQTGVTLEPEVKII